VVIEVALFRRRVETDVDGMHCAVAPMCPDNVAMYYAVVALAGAPVEVRAAGGAVLGAALKQRRLEVKDEAVFRRSREVFDGVRRVAYNEEHMRQAREAMASMLRRCVVCVVDPFTFFERFVRCVEWCGSTHYHVVLNLEPARISVNREKALETINRVLKTYHRVVVDEAEWETFYALLEADATPSCTL